MAFVAQACSSPNQRIELPGHHSRLLHTKGELRSVRSLCRSDVSPNINLHVPKMTSLLCRPGLLWPTAKSRLLLHQTRTRWLSDTRFSRAPVVLAAQPAWNGRLVPRVLPNQQRRRESTAEAGEDESGHITTGPHEGIFFFDSMV